MIAPAPVAVDVFPLAHYVVQPTEAIHRKNADQTLVAKLFRLKNRFDKFGKTVRSVEAVILAHDHGHPHVLVLESDLDPPKGQPSSTGVGGASPAGKSPQSAGLMPQPQSHPVVSAVSAGPLTMYRLPGGKCHQEEDELPCLFRKLSRKLFGGEACHGRVEVVDTAATWVRPNFEPLLYPYQPPHVTDDQVKERRTIYVVALKAGTSEFVVPQHLRLIAVPLFELYDNAQKYGTVLASVPHVVSRLQLNRKNDEME